MSTLEITYQNYGSYWEARVGGGWWTGRGETQRKAHDALMKKMNGEYRYHGVDEVELRDTTEPMQMEMFV